MKHIGTIARGILQDAWRKRLERNGALKLGSPSAPPFRHETPTFLCVEVEDSVAADALNGRSVCDNSQEGSFAAQTALLPSGNTDGASTDVDHSNGSQSSTPRSFRPLRNLSGFSATPQVGTNAEAAHGGEVTTRKRRAAQSPSRHKSA